MDAVGGVFVGVEVAEVVQGFEQASFTDAAIADDDLFGVVGGVGFFLEFNVVVAEGRKSVAFLGEFWGEVEAIGTF